MYRNSNLDSINISSAQNRNMLVSFMLYVLYVMAIVSSATHIDLLFNLSSKIPLLGLNITMQDFYSYAPLVLLLFHIDVMYNIDKHLQKLKNSDDVDDNNIYPYIVNFAYLNGWSIKIFMFIIVFAFGNFAFWYLFLEFSVIHIATVYWWHLTLLFLDFVALFVIFGKHYLSMLGGVWLVLIIALLITSKQNYIIIENIDKIEHKVISLINLQNISITQFNGSDISFKNEKEINLTKAQIFNVTITKSRFEFIDMRYSTIDDSSLTNNRFNNINFSHSNISNIDFRGSSFENVNFCDTTFINIKTDSHTHLGDNIKCRENLLKAVEK